MGFKKQDNAKLEAMRIRIADLEDENSKLKAELVAMDGRKKKSASKEEKGLTGKENAIE